MALILYNFCFNRTPKTTTSTTTTSTSTTTTPTTTSTTTTPTTTPSTTTSSTTTTKKPSRRRRSDEHHHFEWSVDALIKNGSIKASDVLFGNLSDIAETITESTTTPMSFLMDGVIPYIGNICKNSTKVLTDPKKIYGYYKRTFIVQNPVRNVTVDKNPWLKHDEVCKLEIRFQGTGPFQYCTIAKSINNITDLGNVQGDVDLCEDWKELDMKNFEYRHFYSKGSNSYSLNVFIKNEVSLAKQVFGIKFYEIQPHSQLSVIIVPVLFTLASIFLIVFGVAYYLQNRNQFLIEVADFNFGETQSIDSLEYKSFLQRLLDSVSDVFIKNNYLDDEGSPHGESSNQSYNQM